MTPAERLQITFELIEAGAPYLKLGTDEQVRRKQLRIRQQNDLVNRRLLDAFVRSGRTGSNEISSSAAEEITVPQNRRSPILDPLETNI